MDLNTTCALMRSALLAGTAVVLALHCEAATAQTTGETAGTSEAQANQSDVFGDIIVTAQKRSQSTQDVGISISAFSSDQLQALGATDVKSVAALVPGFTVAPSSRSAPIYTIRGVGFNTPNASSSSPVGIYYDEVSYPYPAMTAGPSFDMERVEILKGPQGTLYGRNTTGGLVNNIAVKPSAENGGYLRLGGGSYGSYNSEGAINGAITDTLAGRLSFATERSTKGWQVNISDGSRLGEIDRAGARLQLFWKPSSDLSFLLAGNWWRDKSDTQVGQVVSVFPKAVNATVTPENAASIAATLDDLGFPGQQIVTQAFTPTKASQAKWTTKPFLFQGAAGGNQYNPVPINNYRRNNELFALSLRTNWAISSSVDLTALTAYSHYRQEQGQDISGWDIPNAISIDRARIESLSQEIRFSGKTSTLNWIAGIFYAHDSTSENNSNWSPVGTNIGPLRQLAAQTVAAQGGTLAQQEDVLYGFTDWAGTTQQKIDTASIFGQAQYKIAQQFELTLGARYTRDNARFVGCTRDQGDNSIASVWNVFFRANGIPSNVAPGGCVTYNGDLEAVITSGGALPFPAQELSRQKLKQDNFAGRIGLDFHIDRHSLLYASFTRGYKSGAFPNIDANVSTQYAPAKQERVDAFEAGFKLAPASGITINGSAFYYDYKDKQVFGAVPDIIFVYLNRIVNIPSSHLYGFEGEISASPIEGLTARLSGTYIKSKIDEYFGFDQYGRQQDFAGKGFAFTPKVQLNGMLSYGFDVGSDFNARLTGSGRYTARQQGDLIDDPYFEIKPYTIFDANVSLETNDSKYQISFFVKNLTNKYYWTSVQGLQDSVVRFAGMPRTWGGSVMVRF
ncbi:MAG: TonB-dependent receptor [Polynucleobacter sp.]|nr:TonB-dependent receptor [Polynucleobacter sp.]